MGLLCNESVISDSHLWLWRIEEEESFFLEQLSLSESDSVLLAKYTSPSRRLEWLASRFLLRQALGNEVFIMPENKMSAAREIKNHHFFSIPQKIRKNKLTSAKGKRKNAK